MLTLARLSDTRIAKGVTRSVLSNLTGIDVDDLRNLETGDKLREPWFDEAILIASCLNTGGILPLIDPKHLILRELGPFRESDLTFLHGGARIPLTMAIRISTHIGLDDPIELRTTARHSQLWDIISTNERGAEPGQCPYCLADSLTNEPHDTFCLFTNLLRPRNARVQTPVNAPSPAIKRLTNVRSGGYACGLQDLRKRMGMTQQDLSTLTGIPAMYISRIERLDLRLTAPKANVIATALEVDTALLYAQPPEDDQTTVPPAPDAPESTPDAPTTPPAPV